MQNLSERLSLIAGFVEAGSSVCDVGTDHGYLPAFLYLSGKASRVTATDIREKPLKNARNNLERLGAQGVKLILCDGLSGVTRDMCDTVIIAGMGGEVISGIIDCAPFVRDSSVRLILQPMTAARELREYLAQNGFKVEREQAVSENRKIYSVMVVRFCGKPYSLDGVTALIGKLLPDSDASREYIKKQQRIVYNCAKSLSAVYKKQSEYLEYKELSDTLTKILEEQNGI